MSTEYSGDPGNITTPLARTVTGASNATPIVITTSVAHGYGDNDYVLVAGVGGNTAANGLWKITWLSTTTFSLDGSVGNGAYTAGGTTSNQSLTPPMTIPSDGDLRSAASVNAAINALADRTQFLAEKALSRSQSFAASGTWRAPAGVTEVDIEAWGGGGGGGAGGLANTSTTRASLGGGGGGGATASRRRITVVPGTTYTVTIGAGGSGGGAVGVAGSNGADTTFGALLSAPGAMGGGSTNTSAGTPVPPSAASVVFGGMPQRAVPASQVDLEWNVGETTTFVLHGMYPSPGMGGAGLSDFSPGVTSLNGNQSAYGYGGGLGASVGGTSGSYRGGGGGGGGGGGPGGPGGAGGVGGDGNSGGVGVAGSIGSSAGPNSGGGGGGGGGGGQGSAAGGAAGPGAAGGSGKLIVIYFGPQAVIT